MKFLYRTTYISIFTTVCMIAFLALSKSKKTRRTINNCSHQSVFAIDVRLYRYKHASLNKQLVKTKFFTFHHLISYQVLWGTCCPKCKNIIEGIEIEICDKNCVSWWFLGTNLHHHQCKYAVCKKWTPRKKYYTILRKKV